MAVLYKNENNIYAYRDAEGHWVFSREANIGTDDYIMKSTTADKLKPYDPSIAYVTKTDVLEFPLIEVVYNAEPTPDPDYTAILTEYAEAAEASATTAAASASALDERVDDLKELSNLLTTIIG